ALPTSENTTITQEQQQKIQSAVQQAHHRTGLHFQEIYRQLKAQFSVAKYDQLPQGDFEQAIFFINNLKPTTSGRSIPYHENKLELDERQTLPMFYYVSEVLKAAKELETFAKHFKYKKEHALCEIALSTHQILTNSALKRRVESMLFEIADKMQYSSDKKFYGDLIVNP
ncbi:ORF6C domain-containing protein, partial [Rodentibacter pneumotropicus]|uniref:ORF6C domain-containing protein n=1 Tax=Rodentibacter pneumotropicus TaxID=758 RepID=UPI00113B0AF7